MHLLIRTLHNPTPHDMLGSCTLAFSSLGLIINQLVDMHQRASLNGLVMAIGSASKTAGPFLGAWVFAWSISDAGRALPFIDYRFIFIILMVTAVCSALVPVRVAGVVAEAMTWTMPPGSGSNGNSGGGSVGSVELSGLSYERLRNDDEVEVDEEEEEEDDCGDLIEPQEQEQDKDGNSCALV